MTGTPDSTANWGMVGHEWAVGFLRRGLLNRRTRHAYLFTGARALGKMRLARTFAMALNCEHESLAGRPCGRCRACQNISAANSPDLILPAADASGQLKIDAIREVSRLLALKPYAARYRIAIFDDFDLTAPLAQDALLKTLEEPPPSAVLMLLAQSAERILPTIRSRAQNIPLRPLPLPIIKSHLMAGGIDEDRADLIARLSSGRIGWALAALEDDEALAFRQDKLELLRDVLAGGRLERIKIAEKMSRDVGRDKPRLRNILEIWQTYWRDVLLESHGSPVKPCNSDRKDEIRSLAMDMDAAAARRAMRATRRTLDALRTNANLRLALDVLFLEYPRLD